LIINTSIVELYMYMVPSLRAAGEAPMKYNFKEGSIRQRMKYNFKEGSGVFGGKLLN
jgi:hypothetical protein